MNVFGQRYSMIVSRQQKSNFILKLKKNGIDYKRWHRRYKNIPIEQIEVINFLFFMDELNVSWDEIPEKLKVIKKVVKPQKPVSIQTIKLTKIKKHATNN